MGTLENIRLMSSHNRIVTADSEEECLSNEDMFSSGIPRSTGCQCDLELGMLTLTMSEVGAAGLSAMRLALYPFHTLFFRSEPLNEDNF